MSYICLIANEKGIVAASDTRENLGNFRYYDNRQKVFSDKKQGLIWACCGLTVCDGKDYLRLVEFIMRDSTTTFDEKISYIERAVKKGTKIGYERIGNGSAMDILVGYMGKRTMLTRINIGVGVEQKKTFFAPFAMEGGIGRTLVPKMKLSEYNTLGIGELKSYAQSRVKTVMEKDWLLSKENPNRPQTIGGRVTCEVLKKCNYTKNY